MKQLLGALVLGIATAAPLAAQEDPGAAVQDYMDFTTYEAGIILPAQLTEEVWPAVHFVDTRSGDQFAAGTIPGAAHIEWREVPARLDELPEDGMVVLFCNTGTLSAQAMFAARLMGRENVMVLQTGLLGWRENAAYKPTP